MIGPAEIEEILADYAEGLGSTPDTTTNRPLSWPLMAEPLTPPLAPDLAPGFASSDEAAAH